MARKTIAKDRTWLNTDQECLAAVRWKVEVYYNTETKKAEVNGDITVTEEGRSHWVCRRADLRPIRTMRRIIDAFEGAVMDAYQWISDNGYEFTTGDADDEGIATDADV